MTIGQGAPTSRRPLRLWPGIAAVGLMVATLIASVAIPGASVLGMLGGVVGALMVLVWWLLFSREPWPERLGAVVLMIAALVVTRPFLHPSVAGAGQERLFFVMAIPVLCVALVVWAFASRRLSMAARRLSMAAAIFVAGAAFTLVRTGGITGDADSDLHWRWTPTPEERLLADQARVTPTLEAAPQSAVVAPSGVPGRVGGTEVPPSVGTQPKAGVEVLPREVSPAGIPPDNVPSHARKGPEWPGFRGPHRDDVISGVWLVTDWTTSPPVELWRRRIGPGWSSFAIEGERIYTQEQRGDEEVVACYDRATGEPVWMHRDSARFYESNGGPGPRATPTLDGGRVYALGATGIVNALDAETGARVWSRNAGVDTGAEMPGWGFAGSPLVVDGLVVVAASGALIAYDAATGEPRWKGPSGGAGYSSPHLSTIAGVRQVLLLRGSRTTSVSPADGTVLWEHTWQPSVSIVQPVVTPEGDVFVAPGDSMGGIGVRRLAVTHGPEGWTAEERWTTRGLKPYFNDFVVHKGHAYGFDGSILACIDVADGARKWKGGRYGSGQFILLADQDLLLVLSEDGELALVQATPDKFTEVARVPAIEGKTWNHPVLVGDVLFVRNGEEMAAFRMSLAGR